MPKLLNLAVMSLVIFMGVSAHAEGIADQCRADVGFASTSLEDCPEDATSLIKREEVCYRLRDEVGSTHSTRHQSARRQMEDYECDELADDRQEILRKYVNDQAVTAALRDALKEFRR